MPGLIKITSAYNVTCSLIVLLLAVNIGAARVLPELSNKNISERSDNVTRPQAESFKTFPPRLAKTIQQPLAGAIDGRESPELIPDHVAYELILRAFGSQQDQDVITRDDIRITKQQVKQDRVYAMSAQAGLEIWEMDALLAAAGAFVQQVGVLDGMVAEIKRKNWPDPVPEVMAQLTQLQRQKESLIADTIGSLQVNPGEECKLKLDKYARDQVKRRVKFFPVPHPRKAHELHHSTVGQAKSRPVRPVAHRAAPAQGMGDGAYCYTNTYVSGDNVIGYSCLTNSFNTYGHEYRLTASITAPNYSYVETVSGFAPPSVENSTYMSLSDGEGYFQDGVFTYFNRVEVFCSIGFTSWLLSEITDTENVPPPAPSLSGPSSVTRVATGTYTIQKVTRSAQISNWQFSDGANPAVTRSPSTTSRMWSGKMVTSGSVSVRVVQGGTTYNLTKSTTVNKRTNFASAAVSATKVQNGFTTPLGTVISVPTTPVPNGVIGRFQLEQVFTFNFTSVSDNGPNHGFKYITSISPSSVISGQTVNTAFYYVISPDLENTSSAFYQAQCGNYNQQTKPNGFISGAQLLANTIRHESGAAPSHYQNYVQAQNNAANNVGVVAEAEVGPSGETDNAFQTRVSGTLNGKISAILTAAQVEPCMSHDARLDGNCVFRGNINFAPYQPCQ